MRLQAQFAQRAVGGMPGGMAPYMPPPGVPGAPMYYGQPPPGMMPPQPQPGFGFQPVMPGGPRPGMPGMPGGYGMPMPQRQGVPGAQRGRGGRGGPNGGRGQRQNMRYQPNVMPMPPMPTEAAPANPMAILASQLSAAAPDQQRMILGEALYPLVEAKEAANAAKITGMLLEMDQSEVLHLIESPDALAAKVAEALAVLKAAAE